MNIVLLIVNLGFFTLRMLIEPTPWCLLEASIITFGFFILEYYVSETIRLRRLYKARMNDYFDLKRHNDIIEEAIINHERILKCQ